MAEWLYYTPELTPAQRGFLRVLRAAVDGHAPDEPPADWGPVLDLASAHHVAEFLYPIVCSWAPSCQPDAPLMSRWRTSFLNAAAFYTRAAIQARELLETLRAAEIRVIPLKGVWLAERVYEDGTCRPMCDIDLLVPAEDLARARAAIEAIGYTTRDYYLSEACDKHVHYQKPGTPLMLELHWRLWHPGTEAVAEPDLARMWTGLHEERLHGVPVWVFPPERQLVFLTQHILQHALTVPLKLYLDLILLCRLYAPDFDQARLADEAGAWQVPFGAKFVLQLAGDIFAVRPPASLTSFVPSGGEYEKVRRAALCAALQLTCDSKHMTPALASLYQVSGLRRIRIGLARIFYPPSELRQSCPQVVRRFGLVGGYLWRCADLFRRHSRTLRKVSVDCNAGDPALANFATRQTLGAWLREHEAQVDEALEMGGAGEHVEEPGAGDPVPAAQQDGEVAGKGGGVAGDVKDAAQPAGG